ncbi:sucrase ferredoxin [Deinococcus sp. SL84]|uniref:sucrase ferredoxin n=1 Tax=Deinococcus sp. SL84 TaxID=2994663 RepID=UPI0022727DD5|nr:sucrase ferredoxin [Deinococcus sp. SL84]MCY1703466.1 sucraseferredoxin family protein [Deinococcus sp. SL84]
MTSGPANATSRLPLCADVSRHSGAQPAGSAHRWDTCIAFEATVHEWDLFRDPARMSEPQRRAMSVLGDWVAQSGLGYGLLMFAPRDLTTFDARRRQVRVYTRPPGPLGSFVRQDFCAGEEELWALFSEHVAGVGHSAAEPVAPQAGSDWHLCTHGRVDSSCGKYGAALFQTLHSEEPRLWRTSHFGGHRFAPTLLELPAGRYWAHLTPELTRRLARRTGDWQALAECYRGCAGFSPAAQYADAAAFQQAGWWWLDARREADVLRQDEDGFEVELRYWPPQGRGQPGRVHVQGERTHTLHLPASSHAPELYPEPQYRLTLAGHL